MAKTNKTSKRAVAAIENRDKAFQYRKLGYSYSRIAKVLGVTPAAVYFMVRDKLQELNASLLENAKEVFSMELERLDSILIPALRKAKKGDMLALDRVLKIMDRRARYLGLDAPKEYRVYDGDKVAEELSALAREQGLGDNASISLIIAAAKLAGDRTKNYSAISPGEKPN